MNETTRRGFLGLVGGAVLVAITGCEPLNDATWKGKKRSYPCGKYVPTDPNTFEYTVVTVPRYSVRVNGKWIKRSKIFILCGKQNARAWKRSYPKDSVTFTSRG